MVTKNVEHYTSSHCFLPYLTILSHNQINIQTNQPTIRYVKAADTVNYGTGGVTFTLGIQGDIPLIGDIFGDGV